jgi:hypothetical protein
MLHARLAAGTASLTSEFAVIVRIGIYEVDLPSLSSIFNEPVAENTI